MGCWSHCPAQDRCCSAFYLTSYSTSRTAAVWQDGFLEGLGAQVGHGRETRAEVWKQQALGEPCGRYWRTATCSYLLPSPQTPSTVEQAGKVSRGIRTCGRTGRGRPRGQAMLTGEQGRCGVSFHDARKDALTPTHPKASCTGGWHVRLCF